MLRTRSLRAGLLALVLAAMALSAPAAAQASFNLAIGQTVSTHLVA